MLSKKSIYETLAALGAGALMATGCGGSQPTPVNASEVPAAQDATPAAEATPAEAAPADAPAAPADAAPQATGTDAAAPAGAQPATAAAATQPAAATPTPAATGTTAAKPAQKPAQKPAGTKPKKPKDSAAACGEGTCG